VRVRNYNEGQSATLTFVFADEDDEVTEPTTARYRIDCLTTGRVVRDWTTLTVATSVEVAITPDDTAILVNRNPSERKQVVVQSNYGTDEQAVAYSEFTVKNLQGVT
jgi:hypothetical protein